LSHSDKGDFEAPKELSCFFLEDVLCTFRKAYASGIMNRCLTCPHYRRFEKEMDEQDERVMDEIDRIRKYGRRF